MNGQINESSVHVGDAEVRALVAVASVMDPLDAEARKRVITWAHSRYGFHESQNQPTITTAKYSHVCGRNFLAWDHAAALEVENRLLGTTRDAFMVLVAAGSEWTESRAIEAQTGAHPQGLRSVFAPVARVAAELLRPNPVEKSSARIGKTRDTRWRLAPAFVTAFKGEAVEARGETRMNHAGKVSP